MPLTGQTGGGAAANYVRIIHQEPNGVDGGGSVGLSWNTRTFNTITDDLANLASIAANIITLQPGVYRCRISTPCFNTQSHRARLWNVDTNSEILQGQNADNSNGNTDKSYIVGRFTLAVATQLRVDTYPGATTAAFGLGRAQAQAGLAEVYSVAEFFQVGIV